MYDPIVQYLFYIFFAATAIIIVALVMLASKNETIGYLRYRLMLPRIRHKILEWIKNKRTCKWINAHLKLWQREMFIDFVRGTVICYCGKEHDISETFFKYKSSFIYCCGNHWKITLIEYYPNHMVVEVELLPPEVNHGS